MMNYCHAFDNGQDSYSRLAALIRPSVVTIIVYGYDGKLKHVGSGFFYNAKGDIVANNNVFGVNTQAEIKIISGEKYAVDSLSNSGDHQCQLS